MDLEHLTAALSGISHTTPERGQETYAELVKAMPDDERNTAQVGKVFDLLVCGHQQYGQSRVDESWGWARKKAR